MDLTKRSSHFGFGQNWQNYAATIDSKDKVVPGFTSLGYSLDQLIDAQRLTRS